MGSKPVKLTPGQIIRVPPGTNIVPSMLPRLPVTRLDMALGPALDNLLKTKQGKLILLAMCLCDPPTSFAESILPRCELAAKKRKLTIERYLEGCAQIKENLGASLNQQLEAEGV